MRHTLPSLALLLAPFVSPAAQSLGERVTASDGLIDYLMSYATAAVRPRRAVSRDWPSSALSSWR